MRAPAIPAVRGEFFTPEVFDRDIATLRGLVERELPYRLIIKVWSVAEMWAAAG